MSVILESSFSIEDIINTPESPGRRAEPKPAELLIKLRKLQQAKRHFEDEVKETMLLRGARKEEEDACMYMLLLLPNVTAEALQLEGTLDEKEELNRSLQLKCEDLQLEAQRQLEQNHHLKEEALKQYCFQIQETKLKHRKIRMKFENQLQQLMEQHRNLSTVFTPQRLPAEIQSAEYTTEQLLKAEQQKLEQLTKLLDGFSLTQNAEMHMDTCEKAP
ncbi:synaptonemal complex central element protein 1-like isoform X2 [Cyprinus carpio]|uniref:Synaptonemal complex central element protein 1-like isoform X2 n=1 Tax=Cyprinus carpio TaxID=7962 RepID=A0A9Q9VJX1_CYPCA|nr:synaptonemal complex central element protein 1-like isoform X2 [Cyprinus carpio]